VAVLSRFKRHHFLNLLLKQLIAGAGLWYNATKSPCGIGVQLGEITKSMFERRTK